MRSQNPYELLELAPTATTAEVKAAYRRLVRLYHPDNNPGFPLEAAAKLRDLRDAYDQALAGWTPGAAPALGRVPTPGPAPAAPGPAFTGRGGRRGRRGSQTYQRPWQPPPPNRHDNPPRNMDPPKVPPKQQEPEPPQPPQPKYAHVPPPRAQTAARADRPVDVVAEARRRAVLVEDLVRIGFVEHPDEVALDHAIVDALLPLLQEGEHLRFAARYDGLAAAGKPATVRHHEVFLHVVPTAGGDEARREAIAALIRAQFVACTDDRLLWTVSRFSEVDAQLLQERVEVHAEPLSSIVRASLMQGGVGLGFAAGLAVRVSLGNAAAARLVAAVEHADGGTAAAR